MTNRDYFGFKGMIQRRQHAQPFPLTRPIAPFPDSHPHPERVRQHTSLEIQYSPSLNESPGPKVRRQRVATTLSGPHGLEYESKKLNRQIRSFVENPLPKTSCVRQLRDSNNMSGRQGWGGCCPCKLMTRFRKERQA
ncbi:hypothetical protein CDV36_015212 [Fusarium kuroshium]|uniref:Uncharacterized protein n=1 Tax=Fusarium kuroshium TaxID=2010991 RepID=A0A3M2RD73_9HYPO|nr:hypothetical protein CDV36_015212 [Fusarium kuroshium]